MKWLKCIAIVTLKSFIAKETLRVVVERVAKVFFVVIHSPLVNSDDGLYY